MQRVLLRHAALMVGNAADEFHFLQSSTTAAAISKLRFCDGYLTLYTDEAGRCLDLSFAGHGSTDKSSHVDLTHFLDAAHGAEFSHTTMLDRQRAAKKKPVHPEANVAEPESLQINPTNMQVLWLQQELYFLRRWLFTSPLVLCNECSLALVALRPAVLCRIPCS